MTFVELYLDALDHELGSQDRAQLFTVARRKAAVNRAHKEFARLGKISLPREVVIPVVNGTAQYDLDAATADRFASFGRPPLRLRSTGTGRVAATSLVVRTTAWLDEARPDWRDSQADGAPEFIAHDPRDGVNYLVFVPIPRSAVSETWELVVPYQANPANMVGDAEEPFDGRPDTEPYHWALAHFGAAILERLRKDPDAEKNQIAKFGAYIEDWNATRRPPGAHKHVLMQRDYLREVSRARSHSVIVQGDPRR